MNLCYKGHFFLGWFTQYGWLQAREAEEWVCCLALGALAPQSSRGGLGDSWRASVYSPHWRSRELGSDGRRRMQEQWPSTVWMYSSKKQRQASFSRDWRQLLTLEKVFLLSGNPNRPTQKHVSFFLPDLINLTMKINHHALQGPDAVVWGWKSESGHDLPASAVFSDATVPCLGVMNLKTRYMVANLLNLYSNLLQWINQYQYIIMGWSL